MDAGCQAGEGAGFETGIIVEEKNELAGAMPQPEVVPPGEAQVGWGSRQDDLGKPGSDELPGSIDGGIVDQDDLKVLETLRINRGQAFFEVFQAVVVDQQNAQKRNGAPRSKPGLYAVF